MYNGGLSCSLESIFFSIITKYQPKIRLRGSSFYGFLSNNIFYKTRCQRLIEEKPRMIVNNNRKSNFSQHEITELLQRRNF